jgi:hypothetical protein
MEGKGKGAKKKKEKKKEKKRKKKEEPIQAPTAEGMGCGAFPSTMATI